VTSYLIALMAHENLWASAKYLPSTVTGFSLRTLFAFASTRIKLPEFVAAFLSTFWGRRQVEHVSRQILMSNINAQEIRALQIPLPQPAEQKELLFVLNAARAAHLRRLTQADELFSGLDKFVLDELGLDLPASSNHMVYATVSEPCARRSNMGGSLRKRLAHFFGLPYRASPQGEMTKSMIRV
jgi:hypothetical protein